MVYGIFCNIPYNLDNQAEEGTLEKEDNQVGEQNQVELILVEDIRAGNQVDNQVEVEVDKQEDMLEVDNQLVEEGTIAEDIRVVQVEVDSLEALHKD